MTTRMLAALSLILATAACNGGGGGGYNPGLDAYNPVWGQMMNTGTQMMIQPPRSSMPMCFTNPSPGGGFSTWCN